MLADLNLPNSSCSEPQGRLGPSVSATYNGGPVGTSGIPNLAFYYYYGEYHRLPTFNVILDDKTQL